MHGNYSLNANGSITLFPFEDGFQQVQDPCAAQSNFLEPYNSIEYFMGWRIYQDPTDGPKLHLFMWDGTPVAPQYQVSTTPNMLPTQLLRNVTPAAQVIQRRGEYDVFMKRSAALANSRWISAVLGAAGMAAVASTILLL